MALGANEFRQQRFFTEYDLKIDFPRIFNLFILFA